MTTNSSSREEKSSLIVDTVSYSVTDGVRSKRDYVTVEEPLEIRLCLEGGNECRAVSVTMRTPGDDVRLALGFLFTEGVIGSRDDVLSIGHPENQEPGKGNIIEACLRNEVYMKSSGYGRNLATNSSCGVCGKTAINEIFTKGRKIIRSGLTVLPSMISSLPGTMRKSQSIFGETGGTHAAGIFDSKGELVSIAEDVGRHNAVDKVVGDMILKGMVPATHYVMQISGRAGFEIVQKAVMAGIPIISSVSAPSSLAVETADAFNATLVCFVRDGRFNIYSHRERIETA